MADRLNVGVAARLSRYLQVLTQARKNLVGNGRDLWSYAGDSIQEQADALRDLEQHAAEVVRDEGRDGGQQRPERGDEAPRARVPLHVVGPRRARGIRRRAGAALPRSLHGNIVVAEIRAILRAQPGKRNRIGLASPRRTRSRQSPASLLRR